MKKLKKVNKSNGNKMRYHIWFYFIVFTIIVVTVIWVFQSLFIESYFSRQKYASMTYFAKVLNATTSDGEFDIKSKECNESGIVVFITDTENDNNIIYPTNLEINKINKDSFNFIYQVATNKLETNRNNQNYVLGTAVVSKNQAFYYFISPLISNNNKMLLLICPQQSVKEAINVSQTQLIMVTIVVIFMGFFLSWFLSIKLSKPIDEMCKTAKKWSQGDNNVKFETSNYSEINELAQTLNYAKDGVEKSAVLQRDVLANVSHDLKTPLTMIKAYAEMIKDISGDNKQKREKHTKVIIEETDRLTMLVNDILNLSKLQSNVDSLEKTEVNLSELINTVIARFSTYVESQGYKIISEIESDLFTFVDAKKIEQVVYNLIGNSVNYTGEDKTVKIYLTSSQDKILFEVIDSGKGIKEEKLKDIWDRYYRFSDTNSRPVKGTGLGLSIVKAILDNHKLRFGVISKENKGSNFFIEFEKLN